VAAIVFPTPSTKEFAMTNPAHLTLDSLQNDVAGMVGDWVESYDGDLSDEVVRMSLAWDLITVIRERTLREVGAQVRQAMRVIPLEDK
jgi:hypothetical protein